VVALKNKQNKKKKKKKKKEREKELKREQSQFRPRSDQGSLIKHAEPQPATCKLQTS
jgi:hypothetical protein